MSPWRTKFSIWWPGPVPLGQSMVSRQPAASISDSVQPWCWPVCRISSHCRSLVFGFVVPSLSVTAER